MNFDKIYQDHNKEIMGYFMMRTRDRELSEELTQDTFVKLSKHLHKYDPEKASMRTWIFRIAQNIFVDELRRKDEELTHISDFVDEEGNELLQLSGESNPEKDMILQEYRDALKSVVEGLKNPYRQVAEMTYFQDMSYEEIMKSTGMKLGTVKGNLHRARTMIEVELLKLNLVQIPK